MKSFVILAVRTGEWNSGSPIGVIQALSREEAMTRLGLDQDPSGLPQEARDFLCEHGEGSTDEDKALYPADPDMWWPLGLGLQELPELPHKTQLLAVFQTHLYLQCGTGKYTLPAL